jgi:hypothetical protein
MMATNAPLLGSHSCANAGQEIDLDVPPVLINTASMLSQEQERDLIRPRPSHSFSLVGWTDVMIFFAPETVKPIS